MVSRRLISFIAAFGMAASVFAASPLQMEDPITSLVSQTCVSVSTFAWTAIPASNGTGRTTVNICNPATTGAYIGLDNTKAVTVPGGIVSAGGNFSMQIDGPLTIYAVSLSTITAQNVCVMEVKQ